MSKLLCRAKWWRSVVALALPLAFGQVAPLAAQTPTPDQVRQSLENPGNAPRIRQKIQESGLTQDQIRARLQASGYPADLLDRFLTNGPGQDTSSVGDNQLSALNALGLSPSLASNLPNAGRDSLAGVSVHRSNVFGVDVLRRSATQYQPLFTGPVPADYRLGAGDVLVVILTGAVQQVIPVTLTREGFAVLPQVGQVNLANLTLAQAKTLLLERVRRVYSGVGTDMNASTRFDVTVSSVRAIQVYTVGEVLQPGAYELSALGTALAALYVSGGITETANSRAIQIRRGGRIVATLDLYDYLLRGDTKNDVPLQEGDVVFVPVRTRRIAIFGHVVRQGYYDARPDEALPDLLGAAGGLKADAASRITISRALPMAQRVVGGPARSVLSASPSTVDGAIPAIPLEDGDSVFVMSLGPSRRGFIQVFGSVYQSGEYGLEPGMRLSQAIARAGGLLPATYRGRAHIHRLDPTDPTRTLIAVSLPSDSAAPWTDDPILQDYDSISVYGRPEMRENATVTITGMVMQPGTFPWREGMTLRDAVLMARGMKVGAMLDSAEIARLPEERTAGQLATTIRVALDSTYLFDRDSTGRAILPPGRDFPARGAPETPLKPWDNVLIFAQPDFEFQRSVYIGGEVRFPGSYSLRNRRERLTTLLRRAGGLNSQAYPEGITFHRSVRTTGWINIDLNRALRDSNAVDNVILQPGDSILIPEYQASVRIMGAVNSPGSVLYKRGASLGYYISGAGGYSRIADAGRTSVRAANGETRTRTGHSFLFFGGSDPTPGPGAVIMVPEKDPSQLQKPDYVAIWGAVASILASTVTTIVVLTR